MSKSSLSRYRMANVFRRFEARNLVAADSGPMQIIGPSAILHPLNAFIGMSSRRTALTQCQSTLLNVGSERKRVARHAGSVSYDAIENYHARNA